ncbi:hypothetical protein LCGC14_2490400 [marine sediment metagenome]|uniref:Twin-arginine translocation signal domain-containing protein n=1 Tax=marine sediment metagenome TaxID=412755 RepID=A0A0F9B4Z3_9ZZZZ
MITRRNFLKATGVGFGAIALPSWLVLPEPASDIQKYFSFLECDGRILLPMSGLDASELISYIWCSNGEKPLANMGLDKDLKYYYTRTEISRMVLYHDRDEAIATFQGEVRSSRDELEAFIKKELGDRNIWTFDHKKPYEMKLLKRI